MERNDTASISRLTVHNGTGAMLAIVNGDHVGLLAA
jgi:hypothetical protein